jgi:lysozyme
LQLRPLPDALIPFLRKHEDARHRAYRDLGGVWTCGVGSTTGVTPNTIWTDTEIDRHLAVDLEVAQHRLQNVIGEDAVNKLNDNQYAALLSFVFNAGAGQNWKIWALIKAGRYNVALAHLALYIRAGGRISAGLISRRAAEAALFLTPVRPSSTQASAPTKGD